MVDGRSFVSSFASVRAELHEGGLTKLAHAILDRAEVLERTSGEGGSGVWIVPPNPEALLTEAKALEGRATAGEPLPLYGLPFAVKDNIDVGGLPTTAACPAFARVAERDAEAVARLRRAGALFVGKTNLDQFATGLVGTRSPYGIPRNPFDPRYIVGGSSSGSAAAVARGLVAFALGTDTAGSGRVPAAFTNLVGWKPSRGLVSTGGVVPACRSLDCVSVFTRHVAEAREVAATLVGHDPADPHSRREATGISLRSAAPRGFRFGVPLAGELDFLGDGDAAALFEGAARRLETIGGQRAEISFAPLFAAAKLLYDGPWIAERRAGLAEFLEVHADQMLPVTRQILEGGARVTGVDVFRGMHELAALAARAQRLFDDVDVLLAPTTPTIFTISEVLADPFAKNTALGRYTNFVNLLDLAALAYPMGFRRDGLPLGATLLGRWGDDGRLFTLAEAALGATASDQVDQSQPATMRLWVVGAHLSGMPLNHQLTSLGGRFVRATTTAPVYRLYALANTTPAKPGLVRVDGEGGAPIAGEVWELPMASFGSFFANVRAPLCIGRVLLADGEEVPGFLCEASAIAHARNITSFGGWRRYLAAGPPP